MTCRKRKEKSNQNKTIEPGSKVHFYWFYLLHADELIKYGIDLCTAVSISICCTSCGNLASDVLLPNAIRSLSLELNWWYSFWKPSSERFFFRGMESESVRWVKEVVVRSSLNNSLTGLGEKRCSFLSPSTEDLSFELSLAALLRDEEEKRAVLYAKLLIMVRFIFGSIKPWRLKARINGENMVELLTHQKNTNCCFSFTISAAFVYTIQRAFKLKVELLCRRHYKGSARISRVRQPSPTIAPEFFWDSLKSFLFFF